MPIVFPGGGGGGGGGVSPGSVPVTDLQAVPLLVPLPAGTSIKGITFDPAAATIGSDFTSGTVYLFSIYLQGGVVLTTVTFVSSSRALASGTHQIFGIYNAALSQVAVTNDDTSTAWAASTAKTLSLTATYTPPSDGLYYLGFLVVATTPPNLFTSGGFNTVLSTFRTSASYQTGQTALPATAIFGANVDKPAVAWVA